MVNSGCAASCSGHIGSISDRSEECGSRSNETGTPGLFLSSVHPVNIVTMLVMITLISHAAQT